MFLKIGQRPDHGFDQPLGLLSDCHRRIEQFLRVLTAITREMAGGALRPAQRSQLEGALTYFATAAPRHTADEEESLFPRLRACADPAAAEALQLVERLEHDHADAAAHHAAVDSLARGWLAHGTLPAADVDALLARLTALQAIYEAHIAVEDRELFPAAARLLTGEQIVEVGREMAARRGSPAGATKA